MVTLKRSDYVFFAGALRLGFIKVRKVQKLLWSRHDWSLVSASSISYEYKYNIIRKKLVSMITISNNNRGNINYESLLLVLHTPSMLNNFVINR